MFGEVNEALGQNLFKLMRDGPEDILKLTENAQPAIMAHSVAVFTALTREGEIELAKVADFVAGHSLGEYSPLCAAGSFDLATTAKLLKLRGQAMQAAVPVGIARWPRCSAPTSNLRSGLRRRPRRAKCAAAQMIMIQARS